jgi:hypothetical protein
VNFARATGRAAPLARSAPLLRAIATVRRVVDEFRERFPNITIRIED